jgi:hypothetical protein
VERRAILWVPLAVAAAALRHATRAEAANTAAPIDWNDFLG